MNPKMDLTTGTENNQPEEVHDRRQAMQKLGKFAAYAAPLTILAFSQKASAASTSGPGAHASSPASRRR